MRTRISLRAGVAILTAAFTVGAAYSTPPGAGEAGSLVPSSAPVVSRASLIEAWSLPQSHDLLADGKPVVDLYGNEILPAIGRYAVDRDGAMYEEHAPNIALPALLDPET